MKIIVKKLSALLLAIVMLLAMTLTAFAGVDYSVRDAYEECAELYPEFVEKIKANGVGDSHIISLLETVQTYLLNLDFEVTEENFEAYAMEAVYYAMSLRKHIGVRNAIMIAYPEASVDGADGIVNEEFRPLMETIKSIIFTNGMLDKEGDEETDEPSSEPETTPADEPTTAEPTTSEPTTNEPTTEAPTDKATEKPTSGGITGAGTSDGGSNEEETEIPTENEAVESTDESAEKPTVKPEASFLDMDQASWAKDAVTALVGMGIISGYPDGTFLPNKSITRAEFAKIIVLASGRYDKNATCTFTDVKETDWFYHYVASAYKLGFITGRSETVFDPNSNITRADLCLIVYRYIKSINSEFKATGSTHVFADSDKIPAWTTEAVNALYSAGIVGGMGDNKFDPLASATRAQSAKIVHGAIKVALGI